MFKSLRKKISDAAHQYVGEWAYFVGSIMADAFQERLDDINNGDGIEFEFVPPEKPN